MLNLHRGDMVAGGFAFGFDAGDREEVLDWVGEAAVAVEPVVIDGGDGFGGCWFLRARGRR